ncbi:hypothetical protein ONZ51_g8770 [Trametes cubensis]|uniref:CCHC-type domain-containing protein n=1 Tax=Trametes cubensis TaxID=1111947 RepID=A0AAD7TMK5_9APHY|nr:hypothetical protein ONZ51_g8770 [Trametes cubensis]
MCMSSAEPYSCSRSYHLYNSDKARDVYYRESVDKWNFCTNERCPLRYNTKEVPNVKHASALILTHSSQERDITKTHGRQTPVVKNPLPAGKATGRVNSPRVASGSFPTSRVGTPKPQESESPKESGPSFKEKGKETEPPKVEDSDKEDETFRTTVETPEPKIEETIRIKVIVPAPKTEDTLIEAETPEPREEHIQTEVEETKSELEYTSRSATPEFVRKSVPSYMSGTATGESISGAHRYAFTPQGQSSEGGRYGSLFGGPVPQATASSGGVINPSGGGGGVGPGRPGGRPDPEPADPHSPGGGPPGPPGPPGPDPDPELQEAPGNAPQGQGKGKIEDPEVFNGDRDKTRSFLNQLFLLFTARPHDFVNDYTKVATALSFMEGDNINYWKDTTIQRAEEEIRPGVSRGFDSWPVFKRNFLLAFAPVDEVDDSMVNLTTIQLKDYSPVDEFNARNALPEYLLKKISMSYPPPTTIEEWMTRTKEIDHSYHLTEKILANRRGRKAKTSKTRKNVKMVNLEDDSLDINKLSVKERQELQDKGLCFRCRKPGHISRDCPSKPKKPGKPVSRKVRQVTDEDLEDESEEISDEEDDEDEEDNISINALRATDFETGF